MVVNSAAVYKSSSKASKTVSKQHRRNNSFQDINHSVLLDLIQNQHHQHGGNRRGSLEDQMESREFEARHETYLYDKNTNSKEKCLHQDYVHACYESPTVQITVAILIFTNFVISGLQAEMYPGEDPSVGSFFYCCEWFFGMIFLFELIWNMYGSWFLEFWRSGWNWFDFIIVLISLLALMVNDLPGIAVLRLFRAFRVFRLFKRIKSLRMIIDGILASLPGVGNAFLVLGILMGIWSILGVQFFGADAEEEFGTFSAAMFTMWQVMTMDGWASNIARKLIYRDSPEYGIEDPSKNDSYPGQAVAALYFISYIFIAGIIMTNVVVAILLEKYLAATTAEDSQECLLTTRERVEACEADIDLFEKVLTYDCVKSEPSLTKVFQNRLDAKKLESTKIQRSYVALLLEELSSEAVSSKRSSKAEEKVATVSAKVNPTNINTLDSDSIDSAETQDAEDLNALEVEEFLKALGTCTAQKCGTRSLLLSKPASSKHET